MTMKSELIVKDKVAATGALGVPVFRYSCGIIQWRIGGMGLGGSNTPLPKCRSSDKVEPDCKLSRKCLVFLFQHPN